MASSRLQELPEAVRQQLSDAAAQDVAELTPRKGLQIKILTPHLR
ncbi:hypothetical protein V5G28_010300 [Scytonema sp. PRP1]